MIRALKIILSSFSLFLSLEYHVLAQSPTAAAKGFNVFVKGDVSLLGREAEGAVAAGGNVTTGTYQISPSTSQPGFYVGNAPIGLAVRGGLNLSSGDLKINNSNYIKIGNVSSPTNLKIWFKDGNGANANIRVTGSSSGYDSEPRVSLNSNANSWGSPAVDVGNPVAENIFGTGAGQIDIDGAFTAFVEKSAGMKSLTDNLPIINENNVAVPGPYVTTGVYSNNPKLSVNANGVNVLTVTAEVWNSISHFNMDNVPSGPAMGSETSNSYALIINIVNYAAFNKSLDFPNMGLSDAQGSQVLYNFPDATGDLVISGNNTIKGTIFAPQANLTKNGSNNIDGQVIAKSFVHNGGEIHWRNFVSSVPLTKPDPKITITASSSCVKDAPWLHYEVTPDFDATGLTAKIEWLNKDGEIVKTESGLGLKGDLLYPGAAVDQNGKGIAWPGWKQVSGVWQETSDLTASIKKTGASVRITLPPDATYSITYPQTTQTCRTEPPTDSSLPVTLSSFTAEKENCTVKLAWTVAEAKNFSHFEVERSADARTFTRIGDVKFDTGISKYAFTDNPFASESAAARNQYYRLKQVDMDDTFEYSTIRAVSAGSCGNLGTAEAYPNPAVNEVNVKSTSALKQVEILTQAGALVYHNSFKTKSAEASIGISNLQRGLYLLKVTNQEGTRIIRMVKE
ncbi:hypothetical protein DYBT9275_05794 [Dyadobacter sp. CECT 9275]|uniref:T9SS type A sorting domain-containing protein n=1 Tax=Dyadobacter helix TaxID=2822344 RepID=A0A916N8P1_9BACT|nr:choice-of-anchor A family protein [Dyadobacter sp. CECT 9275]CAG5017543.1 hypothetical protein DYBT9275_05794 [Dyadobacter sp. CECT 9275]